MEIIIEFNNLVTERQAFEIEIYDFLVEDLIPDEFWDPVKVGLSPEQIEKLQVISTESDCFICTSMNSEFCSMECCKKIICKDCTTKWFSESVKCPFCVQDLRNCLKNE